MEKLKQKCIREAEFNICADQKYGPLTTKRRNLSIQKRRELKLDGTISGGYVDFPARLMVNFTGEVAADGKKVYKLHSDFSKLDVIIT